MSESDPPPDLPKESLAEPKRLSFREANLGPEHRPEPLDRPHGFFATRKRTVAISLLALGAGSAAIYGLTQRNSDCGPNSSAQWTTGQATPCAHGSGGGSHSGFGFSSGGTSSNTSVVSRGGFGGTGSAHASGGE